MVEIIEESLPGVKVIKLLAHKDERGFFAETYRLPLYKKLGIDTDFLQDNHSYSKKGVIRGMHFQSGPGQAKLITVVVGRIYDVFVDIRRDSPNFGKWGGRILDASTPEQLYIPKGYAHGFAVLSESAHLFYKVSTVFDPKTEQTFRFDDPDVAIKWPFADPILSGKDRHAPQLKEIVYENLDTRCCRSAR